MCICLCLFRNAYLHVVAVIGNVVAVIVSGNRRITTFLYKNGVDDIYLTSTSINRKQSICRSDGDLYGSSSPIFMSFS